MQKLKKYLSVALAILGFLFILALFIFKDSLNSKVSEMVKKQGTIEESESVAKIIDTEFNYEKNTKTYQFTFLEFGATGCSACRKMEKVMEEVKQKHHD